MSTLLSVRTRRPPLAPWGDRAIAPDLTRSVSFPDRMCSRAIREELDPDEIDLSRMNRSGW